VRCVSAFVSSAPTITVQDSSVLTATVGGEAADGFVADQFPKRIIVYYNW